MAVSAGVRVPPVAEGEAVDTSRSAGLPVPIALSMKGVEGVSKPTADPANDHVIVPHVCVGDVVRFKVFVPTVSGWVVDVVVAVCATHAP